LENRQNIAQFITLFMTIASLIIAWKLSKKKSQALKIEEVQKEN